MKRFLQWVRGLLVDRKKRRGENVYDAMVDAQMRDPRFVAWMALRHPDYIETLPSGVTVDGNGLPLKIESRDDLRTLENWRPRDRGEAQLLFARWDDYVRWRRG